MALPIKRDVDVLKANAGQAVVSNSKYCSLPSSFADDLNIGDQVRITRNSNHYALYTVVEFRGEDNPDDVRLGLSGRERLGTGNTFAAEVRCPVVATGLSDKQAAAKDELVERLIDDGNNTRLVLLAPHGGGMEKHTDRQVELIASHLQHEDPSAWICKGWRDGGGAYERWHLPSTVISPRSFPALGVLAERKFTYSMAFHGMVSGGVIIGGTGPHEIKQMLRSAIKAKIKNNAVHVTIADEHDFLNADNPANICNWMTKGGEGGLQLEQGGKVRDHYWQAIAEAVADVFDSLL